MKLFHDVKVIKDCKYYNDNGVFKVQIGTINSAELRDNTFEVVFIDEKFKVENGYITNLLGEKKNKIPYDYSS